MNYTVWHSVRIFRTLDSIRLLLAVWSGSTVFAIPSASFGRMIRLDCSWQSDQGQHCLPFRPYLLDARFSQTDAGSLIRVYTVCHSVRFFWMHDSIRLLLEVWSGSTLFAIPSASFGHMILSDCSWQSDQGLHCLPFRPHLLDTWFY